MSTLGQRFRVEDFDSPEEFRKAEQKAMNVFEAWVADLNASREFERRRAESDHEYLPLLRQLEDSERLTAKDYAVYINT